MSAHQRRLFDDDGADEELVLTDRVEKTDSDIAAAFREVKLRAIRPAKRVLESAMLAAVRSISRLSVKTHAAMTRKGDEPWATLKPGSPESSMNASIPLS
nr:hypothetical protein [Subtercola lobariae]